jgi:hypothetical protein
MICKFDFGGEEGVVVLDIADKTVWEVEDLFNQYNKWYNASKFDGSWEEYLTLRNVTYSSHVYDLELEA